MSMNSKIEKLKAEQEKNKVKIMHLQTRNKEIAGQITELENLDILGMVREQKLSLKELAELFQKLKNTPVRTITEENKEEFQHEEE